MMEYRQIRAMGGKGSAPSQFATSLRGLAVDAHGQLYAAGDSEIKVFDAAGRLKRRWSTARPVLSVAVSTDGAGDGSVYAGQPRQMEIFDAVGKGRSTSSCAFPAVTRTRIFSACAGPTPPRKQSLPSPGRWYWLASLPRNGSG